MVSQSTWGNTKGAPAIRSGTRVLLGASTVTAEYSWVVGRARKKRSASIRPVQSKAQWVARYAPMAPGP